MKKAESVPAPDPRQARITQAFEHNRPLNVCAFDHSGKCLYAAGEENPIQRWDLETGKKTTLHGHASWVRGFTFLPSGKEFITSAYDGRLAWWSGEPDSTSPDFAIDAHTGWVRSIALSPRGQTLASCGNDGAVRLWSTAERKLIRELGQHESHVYSVAFHPGGEFLVSADHKGVVKQWDLANGKLVRELDASPLYTWHKGYRAAAGGVRKMDFSRDGRWLVGCGLTDATDTFGQVVHPAVVVIDWESGERTRLLRSSGDELGVGWGVTFHPSMEFVCAVCGGRNGRHLYFWTTDEEKPFHTFQLPSAARDLALHPDGLRFGVALFDGTVRVIDVTPARERRF